MKNGDEKTLIQEEISLLKLQIIQDRVMIQENLSELMDNLNPLKKIESTLNSFITLTFCKLSKPKSFLSELLEIYLK